MRSIEAIAAERAGCRLVVEESEPRYARFECPDGWAAARFLKELCTLDLDDARIAPIVEIARELRAVYANDADFVRAAHALVKSSIRFAKEEGEKFQHPIETIATRVGDCDCHVRLLTAILRAGGIYTALAFFAEPGSFAWATLEPSGPRHVAALARIGDKWFYVETTVACAELGEHPVDAAKRAGVLRDDIAGQFSEVVTMTIEGAMVQSGNLYRARVCVQDACSGDDIPGRVIEAFNEQGFSGGHAWLDPSLLPGDWRADERATDAPDGAAIAWFEGAYAGGETRALDGVFSRVEVLSLWDRWDDAPADARPRSTIDGTSLTPETPLTIAQTKDIPDRFFSLLKQYAKELRFNPVWILDIMNAESGIHPWAAYRHPPDIATGLIGFVGIAQLGFHASDDNLENHDAFAKLSHVEQLAYVRKFYGNVAGRMQSAANLYQYNFIPASLARGTGAATIVCALGGTGYNGQEDRFYRINKILDHDNDGVITVADLETHLAIARGSARYKEALERLRRAPDASTIPLAAALPIAVLFGLVVRELVRG